MDMLQVQISIGRGIILHLGDAIKSALVSYVQVVAMVRIGNWIVTGLQDKVTSQIFMEQDSRQISLKDRQCDKK